MGFVRRQEGLDLFEIWLQVDELNLSDEIKILEGLVQTMRQELEQSLGIPARVRLVEPGTMEHYRQHLGEIIDERLEY